MPAHLIAREGPLAGLVLPFEKGTEWIIGRDPDVADLVIEDSTVSRKHARITKTPQGIFLQNLSRVNPVLINGEQQEEKVQLLEGDEVQIGQNLFAFVDDQAEDQNEDQDEDLAEEDERPKKGKKTSKKKSPDYD